MDITYNSLKRGVKLRLLSHNTSEMTNTRVENEMNVIMNDKIYRTKAMIKCT